MFNIGELILAALKKNNFNEFENYFLSLLASNEVTHQDKITDKKATEELVNNYCEIEAKDRLGQIILRSLIAGGFYHQAQLYATRLLQTAFHQIHDKHSYELNKAHTLVALRKWDEASKAYRQITNQTDALKPSLLRIKAITSAQFVNEMLEVKQKIEDCVYSNLMKSLSHIDKNKLLKITATVSEKVNVEKFQHWQKEYTHNTEDYGRFLQNQSAFSALFGSAFHHTIIPKIILQTYKYHQVNIPKPYIHRQLHQAIQTLKLYPKQAPFYLPHIELQIAHHQHEEDQPTAYKTAKAAYQKLVVLFGVYHPWVIEAKKDLLVMSQPFVQESDPIISYLEKLVNREIQVLLDSEKEEKKLSSHKTKLVTSPKPKSPSSTSSSSIMLFKPSPSQNTHPQHELSSSIQSQPILRKQHPHP